MRKTAKPRSAKAGLPPGTPVHIGERHAEITRIRLLHYDAETVTERECTSVEQCEVLRADRGVTWVHVTGVHDVALLEQLGHAFGLHPLVIEDISNTEQRPKVEDYDHYLYIVARILQDGTPGRELRAEQVSLILGRDFVLSFEEAEPTAFESVRERLRAGRGRLRGEGADHLAYSLLDAVVDGYFIVLERIGERIELLEEQLIVHPRPAAQRELHKLKREAVLLRRAVWPLREVLGSLERGRSGLIREETRLYLRDVYDHIVHVVDTIESHRDMLSSMLDIYLMSLSNRMNEIMKVLTIIATIFMPLSFIAGLYGMNFRNMPELDWPWGYPLALALMAAVGGGMLLYFRRKKWI